MFRFLIPLVPVLLVCLPAAGQDKEFLLALQEGVLRCGDPGRPSPESAFARALKAARAPGAPEEWRDLTSYYVALAKKRPKETAAAWKEYTEMVFAPRRGKAAGKRLAQAEKVFRVARAGKDPVLTVKAANFLGILLTDAGRLERAREVFREGLEPAERYKLGLLRNALLCNMARRAVVLADYQGALEILARVSGDPAREDPLLAALLERHRAASLAGLGRTEACLEPLARAEEYFRRAQRPARAFNCAVERIRLLFETGRRSKAVREAERLLSSPLAQKDQAARVAAASLLVSFLSSSGKDWDREVEELARKAGEAGKLEYKLGFLLYRFQAARRRRDFSLASRLLLEGEETARRLGGAWARCRMVLARARLMKLMGDREAARRLFRSLAEEKSGKVPPALRSRALSGLASLEEKEGRPLAAAELFLRAAELAEKRKDVFRRANLLARAAGCFFSAGRGRRGREAALQALNLLPRARRKVGSWELGLRILGRKAGVFDSLLTGVLSAASSDPRRAFAFSLAEKLKAGGLYDRILTLETRGGGGLKPFHLLAALEERIRLKKRARAPAREIRDLERKRAELLQVYALPEPGGPGLPESVSLERLQRALPPGLTVLFFHVGGDVSALWAVRRDQVRFRSLPGKEELLGRIALFRRTVSSLPGYGAWRVAWREGRRALDFLLGNTVELLRPGGTVAVIPGPWLESFPFSALVKGPLRPPAGPGEIRFLGPDQGIAFVRAPSASLLVHFLEQGRPDSDGKVLLVEADHPGSLPWLEREFSSLEKALAGRTILRARGREALDLLRKFGSGAGVLHLAGHAWVSEEDPLPRLRLGGERLTPSRILAWRLGPGLVDLAACRSAAGGNLPLEGRAGFARAFLACGSGRVLVAAWEIQDEAAARFNAAFYGNLGKGALEAFRRAQSVLRKNPVFQWPFFWASFQLIGVP